MVVLKFSLLLFFPHSFPCHSIFQLQFVYQSCPVADDNIPTTNLSRTNLGLNPSLRGQRPATDRHFPIRHWQTWCSQHKISVYYAVRTESFNTIPTHFRPETVNSYRTNLLSVWNSNMGVLSFVTQNSSALNTFRPFQQKSRYRNLSPSMYRTLIPMWFQGETTNPQGGCISTATQPFMTAKHKLYASTKRKKNLKLL